MGATASFGSTGSALISSLLSSSRFVSLFSAFFTFLRRLCFLLLSFLSSLPLLRVTAGAGDGVSSCIVSAGGSGLWTCTVCECEWWEASGTWMSAEMSDGDSEVISGDTMREEDE